MRAWQVEEAGEPLQALKLVDKAPPTPPPGEVVIEVAASALSMPDVMQCRRTYPGLPERPNTPGLEYAGVIKAVGEGCVARPGDRVMGTAAFLTGYGAFADECRAFERGTFPLAPGMDVAEASVFTIAYHTAHIGLVRRAQLRAGDIVLVHGGAGGVGLAAIQLAKALGARVLATAGSAVKTAACHQAGADLAIDHTKEDWAAAVMAATDGRGVDIVYDPVGGDFFDRSHDCLAMEGRLLPIGAASGVRGVVRMEVLNARNVSIVGARGGGGWLDRPTMLAMHTELLRLYSEGKIKPVLDRTVDFGQIPEGLTAVANREVIGRIAAIH